MSVNYKKLHFSLMYAVFAAFIVCTTFIQNAESQILTKKTLVTLHSFASGRPLSLTSGDFDEDGVPDLIVAFENNRSSVLHVYKGNADSIYPTSPEARKRKSKQNARNLPFATTPLVVEPSMLPDFPIKVEGKVELPAGVVASLGMRLNKDAVDDVVLLNQDGSIEIEMSSPMAVFVVNSTADPGTGICDPTECTLREAITAANASVGLDEIQFNISGAAPHTIQPATPLGVITDPITIDGTTEPDFAGMPVIELNGASTGGSPGFQLDAGNSTVRGLIINRFSNRGIAIFTNGSNIIEGNFIGTDVTGLAGLGNALGGIFISGVSNMIGGTVAGSGNVVSGNTLHGILIDVGGANNVIVGNLIGTGVTGTTDLGNGQEGVGIGGGAGPNNLIGGNTATARNIISGNDEQGVVIFQNDQIVSGNFIGTDITGQIDLGNAFEGVFVGGDSNIIGGTSSGSGNVISGNNAHGIRIDFGADDNVVAGNLIGTGATGTTDLGNTQEGVGIGSSAGTNNLIGGTLPAARNIISGNDEQGVDILQDGQTVIGNFIGTDINGTSDLGNGFVGISIVNAANNMIGGTTPSERNVISGNGMGVSIQGSGATGNVVAGNFIGTDVTGTVDLGNSQHGVWIASLQATGNVIGGTTVSSRNIISGNDGGGILLQITTGNSIQGNFIGTDISGTQNIGNQAGIFIFAASGNVIGGLGDAANRIAFSSLDGIYVSDTSKNIFMRNSVFANDALGIDMNSDGVTPNDNESDAIQNYPVLISAVSDGSNTEVQGSLNSFPLSLSFDIEFFSNTTCDSTGYGEGQTYLETITLFTDSLGNVNFTALIPIGVPAGQSITATATRNGGSTSEFSACIVVTSLCQTITLAPSSLPAATEAEAYNQNLAASGGNLPYTFNVSSGSLPPGLVLSTGGNLSGTPTTQGSFAFTITATDSNGCTGNQDYTLNVEAAAPAFLLFDDFEDGLFDWDLMNGGCTETAGSLVCTGDKKSTVFAPAPWLPSGDFICSNCTIETDIQLTGGSFSRLFIEGWYQDRSNKVELILKEESDKWVLKQRAGGVVVAKESYPLAIEPGVTYNVRVQFDGTNFAVYVNDAFLMIMPAGALPSGNFGYKVKQTTATFSEIRVY